MDRTALPTEAGGMAWVPNCYPAANTGHWSRHRPRSERPVYVPVRVLHTESAPPSEDAEPLAAGNARVETLWEPATTADVSAASLVPIAESDVAPSASAPPPNNLGTLAPTCDLPSVGLAVYRRWVDGHNCTRAGGRSFVVVNPAGTAAAGRPSAAPLAAVDEARAHALQEGARAAIVVAGQSGGGATEAFKAMLVHALRGVAAAAPDAKAAAQDAAPAASPMRATRRRSSVMFTLSSANAALDPAAAAAPLGCAARPFDTAGCPAAARTLLAAISALEPFTHATTAASRNSSRAGLAVTLGIDPASGAYSSFALAVHGLEDQRAAVTAAARRDGERSFHVLYWMLAALDKPLLEKLGLGGRSASELAALKTAGAAGGPYDDEFAEFSRLQRALTTCGLDPDAQQGLWRVLAAVLILGEVKVIGQHEASVSAASRPLLGRVEDALGLENGAVASQIMFKEAKTLVGVRKVPRSSADAKFQQGRLASVLYGAAVAHVVRTANAKLAASGGAAEPASGASLSLLDPRHAEASVPGAPPPTLAQLLVAYEDERVHAAWLTSAFDDTVSLLKDEGVPAGDLADCPHASNANALAVYERPEAGLLPLLAAANAACEETTAGGKASGASESDDGLFKAVVANMKEHNGAVARGFNKVASRAATSSSPCFIVKHTRGDVKYSADKFVQSNRAPAGAGHVSLEAVVQWCAASTEPAVAAVFAGVEGAGGTKKKPLGAAALAVRNSDRASEQRVELDSALGALEGARTTFVHCLRPRRQVPNAKASASGLGPRTDGGGEAPVFEPRAVLEQIESLQLVEALRLQGSTPTLSVSYAELYAVHSLVPDRLPAGLPMVLPPGLAPEDTKKKGLQLLRLLFSRARKKRRVPASATLDALIAVGNTKVFMYPSLAEALEAEHKAALRAKAAHVTRVQTAARCAKVYWSFQALRAGVCVLQGRVRAAGEVAALAAKKDAAGAISPAYRRLVAARRYRGVKAAALRVQAWWRQVTLAARVTRLRHAVRATHHLARGFVMRAELVKMGQAVVVLQAAARKLLFRMHARDRKLWAVIKLQSRLRGKALRRSSGDVTQRLFAQRRNRRRIRLLLRVQASWSGLLVRRRYLQLRLAAVLLQRWARARCARHEYVRLRRSIVCVQCAIRSVTARGTVRALVLAKMLDDERRATATERLRSGKMWFSQAPAAQSPGGAGYAARAAPSPGGGGGGELAEIAALDLLEAGARDPHQVSTPNTLAAGAARRRVRERAGAARAANKIGLVDVDVQFSLQEMYPNGWLKTVAALSDYLTERGSRVTHLVSGAAHTLARTDRGELYACGWADQGQLGHGTFKASPKFALIKTLARGGKGFGSGVKVSAVCAGHDFTACLSDLGHVYTWGDGRRGQLGHGDFKSVSTPRRVSAHLGSKKVVKLSCGAAHCACVVGSGGLYLWGTGELCGLGARHTDKASPVLNETIFHKRKERCSSVECGREHTLALTSEGNVYAFGSNNHGQLGVGDTRARFLPALVEFRRRRGSGDSVRSGGGGSGAGASPRKGGGAGPASPRPSGPASPHAHVHGPKTAHFLARMVACGARHSFALLSSGALYAWGLNKHAQLGVGGAPSDSVHAPERVKLPAGMQRVELVVGGLHQSALVTAAHEVYMWGTTSCARFERADVAVGKAGTAVRRYSTVARQEKLTGPVAVPHRLALRQPDFPYVSDLCASASSTLSYVSVILGSSALPADARDGHARGGMRSRSHVSAMRKAPAAPGSPGTAEKEAALHAAYALASPAEKAAILAAQGAPYSTPRKSPLLRSTRDNRLPAHDMVDEVSVFSSVEEARDAAFDAYGIEGASAAYLRSDRGKAPKSSSPSKREREATRCLAARAQHAVGWNATHYSTRDTYGSRRGPAPSQRRMRQELNMAKPNAPIQFDAISETSSGVVAAMRTAERIVGAAEAVQRERQAQAEARAGLVARVAREGAVEPIGSYFKTGDVLRASNPEFDPDAEREGGGGWGESAAEAAAAAAPEGPKQLTPSQRAKHRRKKDFAQAKVASRRRNSEWFLERHAAAARANGAGAAAGAGAGAGAGVEPGGIRLGIAEDAELPAELAEAAAPLENRVEVQLNKMASDREMRAARIQEWLKSAGQDEDGGRDGGPGAGAGAGAGE